MIFTETAIKGAFYIDVQPNLDERGYFARTFCADEFREQGLRHVVTQCNMCVTERAGTIRGMHFQISPFEEAKLVRCVRGIIFDVIIDLRPDSPTYLSHLHTKLSGDSLRALYVPEMVAHGYQSLSDDTEVHYQMSSAYATECARGVRFDDPAFGIEWPLAPTIVSERDKSWPFFNSKLAFAEP
jgi:dTDP-4-dehydrorhamnose 3,5-epimerase